MDLSRMSIDSIIQVIADDLGSYIDGEGDRLPTSVYRSFSIGMEYTVECNEQEEEWLMESIHECIYDLSIWENDKEEQRIIVEKMRSYFMSLYGKDEHVAKFLERFSGYYQKELKIEFG